jgi:hypothetical protein
MKIPSSCWSETSLSRGIWFCVSVREHNIRVFDRRGRKNARRGEGTTTGRDISCWRGVISRQRSGTRRAAFRLPQYRQQKMQTKTHTQSPAHLYWASKRPPTRTPPPRRPPCARVSSSSARTATPPCARGRQWPLLYCCYSPAPLPQVGNDPGRASSICRHTGNTSGTPARLPHHPSSQFRWRRSSARPCPDCPRFGSGAPTDRDPHRLRRAHKSWSPLAPVGSSFHRDVSSQGKPRSFTVHNTVIVLSFFFNFLL